MNANRVAVLVLAAFFTLLLRAQEATEVTQVIEFAGDRKPRQTIVPVYPQRALRDRIEGDVEVCFNVDREGRTSRIAVRHSTHRLFEKVAMQAVRESTYAALPAQESLSGIKTCRTFRFRLDPVTITDLDAVSGGVEP